MKRYTRRCTRLGSHKKFDSAICIRYVFLVCIFLLDNLYGTWHLFILNWIVPYDGVVPTCVLRVMLFFGTFRDGSFPLPPVNHSLLRSLSVGWLEAHSCNFQEIVKRQLSSMIPNSEKKILENGVKCRRFDGQVHVRMTHTDCVSHLQCNCKFV